MPAPTMYRNSHSLSVRFGVLLVCMLSIALMGMTGCGGGDAEGKRASLVGYVPDGTLFYASIDADNMIDVSAFYEDAVDQEAHERYKSEMLALIPEMTGLEIDFEMLITTLSSGTHEWFDSEVAVVVGSGVADERPEVAIWVGVSSQEEAEAGFPELLDNVQDAVVDVMKANVEFEDMAYFVEHFSFTFETADYSGTTIHSLPAPGSDFGLHWAATDEALVIGADLEYIHTCIDGLTGEKSHPRAAQFSDAYATHVLTHPLMWMYFDAESGRNLLREEGEYSDIPREIRNELDAISGLLFSINSEKYVVSTNLKALLDPTELAKTEYLKTALSWAPGEHELDSIVHRGSAPLYFSMNNVGDMTRFIVNKTAEHDPHALSNAKETIREATGHTLDAVIAAVGDEMAMAFHGLELDITGMMMGQDDAVKVDMIFALEVEDEELVRDLLRFACEALPEASDGEVLMNKENDNLYIMKTSKGADFDPVIVLDDSRLIVGVGIKDFADTATKGVGDPIQASSNLKVVMDWPAVAKVCTSLIESLEQVEMLQQLIKASPENESMYKRWKFFLTEGILVYERSTETMVIDDNAVSFVTTQTFSEERLKSLPYDALIEMNREQLKALAKYIQHELN